MKNNLGTYITIGIFLVGVIAGWGRLQAQTSSTEAKVVKIEDKVYTLKEKTDKLETKQEGVKDSIDTLEKKVDKVIDLLIQQAQKQEKKK